MATVTGSSDLTQSLQQSAMPRAEPVKQSQSVEKTEKIDEVAASRNTDASQKTEQQVDAETLQKMVDEADQYFSQQQPALSFKTHQDTGRTIIKVTDKATGELIRQIPSEEMIELAEKLKQMQQGHSEKGLVFSDLG